MDAYTVDEETGNKNAKKQRGENLLQLDSAVDQWLQQTEGKNMSILYLIHLLI